MIVLIVDDDEGVTGVFKRMLLRSGIATDVRVAHSIGDALAEMSKIPHPDLVFLDLILRPGDTAEQTLHCVEKFKGISGDVVVIVVTGVNDESLPELSTRLGADAFQHKRNIASQDALLAAVKSGIESNLRRAPAGPSSHERNLQLLERLSGLVVKSDVTSPA